MISITDFPTELLLKIFLENSSMDLQFPHNPTITTLKSSQVCRRWRRILLDFPAAWTQGFDIDADFGLQDIILERCRDSPFDTLILPSITDKLYTTHLLQDKMSSTGTIGIANVFESNAFQYLKFYEKMTLLFSQLHRVRRVAIKIPARGWMHLWLSLVQNEQAVKKLESLILVADYGGILGQASFSTCQRLDPYLLYGLPLRPKKYEFDHWKLRSLELRGCTFVLDSPAFGNLEEFSLHNLPRTVAYSPHDLARSVATMSRLKRLEIVNATLTTGFWLRGEDLRFDYNAPTFDLPCLEFLSIRGPTSHCAQLFCRLNVQMACSIELMCEEGLSTSLGSSEPFAFRGLTNRLEARYSSNNISLGDSIFVQVLPNSVTTRNFPFFRQEQQKNTYPSVEISFSWCDTRIHPHSLQPEGPPFVLADLIHGLCRSLTGSTGLHLNFQASIPVDPHQHSEVVRKFLSPFVKLHDLSLYNHETVEFISPYFTHTPCDQETVHRMEFQDLYALFFYDMDLGGILGPCGKPTIDLLQAYIDNRHAAGKQTLGLLGFDHVKGMTKDVVRRFTDAGVDVLHDSGSFGVEATLLPCDVV